MFPHSSSQIHRGPGVKRAVTVVRHDVDPSGHRRQDSRMTMRWQQRRGWPELVRPRGSKTTDFPEPEGGGVKPRDDDSRNPLVRRGFENAAAKPRMFSREDTRYLI